MPVLLIVGSGPGISFATAARFGAAGYTVALVGRDADRLDAVAARLSDAGIEARGYVGDATDAGEIRSIVAAVRQDLGAITVVLFTAFGTASVRNVLTVDPVVALDPFRLGVVGLLTTVQASLDDLRSQAGAAIIVATGAVGENIAEINQFATHADLDGLALEAAGKSKLLGLLAERLRDDDVYVGEIVINGTVLGSPYASPTAIDPARVADLFWSMTGARDTSRSFLAEVS